MNRTFNTRIMSHMQFAAGFNYLTKRQNSRSMTSFGAGRESQGRLPSAVVGHRVLAVSAEPPHCDKILHFDSFRLKHITSRLFSMSTHPRQSSNFSPSTHITETSTVSLRLVQRLRTVPDQKVLEGRPPSSPLLYH
jgi:hypothetical protein